jgi:cellulose synthase/poly-beta-1,6-N-acetylglucosamine synthase-like glycosyltransferase
MVPSYCEEPSVVRRTLLSAVLQRYPGKRVTLLIDDSPDPGDHEAARLLASARALPGEVQALLEKPARRVHEMQQSLTRARTGDSISLAESTTQLMGLNAELAAWFDALASEHPCNDHADRFFVNRFLLPCAQDLRDAEAALANALKSGALPSADELQSRLDVLAAHFDVETGSFERKTYENLSHEPNKAMNLNSYIGLMGDRYAETVRGGAVYLEPNAEGGIEIPDADFLITLDADSVLAPEYSQSLIDLLTQSGHERWGIAQTPYSAFPDPPGELERIAGATTDIQYLLHQGFSACDGAFWVGANAVLRKAAIDELRTERLERGFIVPEYIRDRTVIEDTESSVDLVSRNWTLYNHPERLAWSATPDDFGALTIQRQRWANGGLIILPKLLRHLKRRFLSAEAFVRCHYLVSIALVNVALLTLLLHPFEHALRSPWLPLAAVSYFFLYARDLMHVGYRLGDAGRVYGLNLLLTPVNLAGVWASLRQAATGRKAPFRRTPKIVDRTAVPASILVSHFVLGAACVTRVAFDIHAGFWIHALFVAFNTGLLVWAFVRYIGVREAFEDLRAQLAPESTPDDEWRSAVDRA